MVSVNSSGDGFGRLHFWGQVAALRATVPPCHRWFFYCGWWCRIPSCVEMSLKGTRCNHEPTDVRLTNSLAKHQAFRVWQRFCFFLWSYTADTVCIWETGSSSCRSLVYCTVLFQHQAPPWFVNKIIRIANIGDNICHELLSSTSCYIICNLFYITYMSVSFVLLCYLLFVMFCWYHFVGPFVLWVKYLNHVAIQAQSEAWLAFAFSEVSLWVTVHRLTILTASCKPWKQILG
jgi:hypothetical protein